MNGTNGSSAGTTVEQEDALMRAADMSKAHVGVGLAIRDDGILVPCTPAILQQPNICEYHGDPNWTLEQRLDWLAGRPVRGTEAGRQTVRQQAAQPQQQARSAQETTAAHQPSAGRPKIPSFGQMTDKP
jgi:hypothetical protein